MRLFTKSFFLLVLTLLMMPTSYSSAQAAATSPPVITFAYAQEKIRPGEIWRVYLSANDSGKDMLKIFYTIDQPGGQLYSPDVLFVKKGMEGQLSGYLSLPTNSFRDLWGVNLTLTVIIRDRAGNESKPVRFPLAFNGESMKPLPAEMEKDLNRPIGTIHIQLNRRETW